MFSDSSSKSRDNIGGHHEPAGKLLSLIELELATISAILLVHWHVQ